MFAGFDILNLEANPKPELLYEQEIKVILEVIRQTVEDLGILGVGGACILDGQPRGGEAECILRVSLMNEQAMSRFQDEYGHDCMEMAAIAIDAILEPGEAQRHFGHYSSIRMRGEDAEALSDIYQNGPLKVLVMNATYGRFLFGCCLADGSGEDKHEISMAVMQAVAETLAKLGLEDTVLQESASTLRCGVNRGTFDMTRQNVQALGIARKMFWAYPTPVMRAWRDWHEPANGSGELKLFFQK